MYFSFQSICLNCDSAFITAWSNDDQFENIFSRQLEALGRNKDILIAREILDQDHYGLEKIKERILEFLAVQKRSKSIKGPIGIKLGGKSAPEIALSIIAQLVSETYKK